MNDLVKIDSELLTAEIDKLNNVTVPRVLLILLINKKLWQKATVFFL